MLMVILIVTVIVIVSVIVIVTLTVIYRYYDSGSNILTVISMVMFALEFLHHGHIAHSKQRRSLLVLKE